MSYLITIAITLAVFVGFLLFVGVEERSGTRLFRASRVRLDSRLHRVAYVVRHIDWAGFIAHISKVTFERTAHDVVHFTLVAVRSIERTLTRMIRILRERVASRTTTDLPAEGSPFLNTLIKFHKKNRKPPTGE